MRNGWCVPGNVVHVTDQTPEREEKAGKVLEIQCITIEINMTLSRKKPYLTTESSMKTRI